MIRDASKLRRQLERWCRDQNGALLTRSEHNVVVDGVVGGSYRVPLGGGGALIVFLPSDSMSGIFSICTRFENAVRARSASASGKWNFYAEDGDTLFDRFTKAFDEYMTQRYTGELR